MFRARRVEMRTLAVALAMLLLLGLVPGTLLAGTPASTAEIEGLVWDDVDSDGEVGSTEFTAAGFTVYADYDGDGVLDNDQDSTFVNDNDGTVEAGEEEPYFVSINGYLLVVQVGTWIFRGIPQANGTCTGPNVPDANLSDAIPACAMQRTLTEGQHSFNNHFFVHLEEDQNTEDLPPTIGEITATFLDGAPARKAGIELSWQATDDNLGLEFDLQRRVRVNGLWRPWKNVQSGEEDEGTVVQAPLWTRVQYRARVRDGVNPPSDWSTGDAMTFARRDDRQFTFSAGWTIVADADAMRGTVRRSSTAGSTAMIVFRGNGVTVVGPTGPSYGMVEYCVDPGTPAQSCETVNIATFIPFEFDRRQISSWDGLTQGPHVLRVTLISGTWDLDGAIVRH